MGNDVKKRVLFVHQHFVHWVSPPCSDALNIIAQEANALMKQALIFMQSSGWRWGRLLLRFGREIGDNNRTKELWPG